MRWRLWLRWSLMTMSSSSRDWQRWPAAQVRSTETWTWCSPRDTSHATADCLQLGCASNGTSERHAASHVVPGMITHTRQAVGNEKEILVTTGRKCTYKWITVLSGKLTSIGSPESKPPLPPARCISNGWSFESKHYPDYTVYQLVMAFHNNHKLTIMIINLH